jgi:putative colanic acid biosynthesis UDP-glucose lipid carrier transferase
VAGGKLMKVEVSGITNPQTFQFAVIQKLVFRALVVWLLAIATLWLDGARDEQLFSALSFAVNLWLVVSLLVTATIWISLQPRFRRHSAKVAVVGVTAAGIAFAQRLQNQPNLAMEFVGFIDDRRPDRLPDHAPFPILCRADEVKQYLMQNPVEHVMLSLPGNATFRLEQVVEQLLDSTASVHYLHDFLMFRPIREKVTSIGNTSVFTIIDSPRAGWNDILKRIFDVVAAASALILLSPLLAIVAAWIKFDSPGPVLFKQKRWGEGAAPFQIYKFRSMTKTASASTHVAQATKHDARVTKVGTFIRRTSIDELPQLFNILLGDMSLVGPRPHAIAHNQEYRSQVKGYMLRHKIKPGLTGWAQIHGLRGETDTLDKMEGRINFDLEYLRNWTFVLDLYIIYRTVGLVFNRKNAY